MFDSESPSTEPIVARAKSRFVRSESCPVLPGKWQLLHATSSTFVFTTAQFAFTVPQFDGVGDGFGIGRPSGAPWFNHASRMPIWAIVSEPRLGIVWSSNTVLRMFFKAL